MNLDDLKALADAATPGPWFSGVNPMIGGYCVATQPPDAEGFEATQDVADFVRLSDAAFIAAARTAVPDLIARVEVAEAEVERLRSVSGNDRTGQRPSVADLDLGAVMGRAMIAQANPGEDWTDVHESQSDVLDLIAEVERLRGACICFADYGDGQQYANGPNQDCPLHGINARDEANAARVENARLRAAIDRVKALCDDADTMFRPWSDNALQAVEVEDIRRAIEGES